VQDWWNSWERDRESNATLLFLIQNYRGRMNCVRKREYSFSWQEQARNIFEITFYYELTRENWWWGDLLQQLGTNCVLDEFFLVIFVPNLKFLLKFRPKFKIIDIFEDIFNDNVRI